MAHGPGHQFHFAYGDPYHTGSFTGTNMSQVGTSSDWKVVLPVLMPRIAEGQMDRAQKFNNQQDDHFISRHGLETWQKVTLSMRDAFLEFKGSAYLNPEWDTCLRLSASINVFSFYGFRGGVYISGLLYCSRYLENPQTLRNRINLNKASGVQSNG